MYLADFFTLAPSRVHPKKLIMTTGVFNETSEDRIVIATLVNEFNKAIEKLPNQEGEAGRLDVSDYGCNQMKLTANRENLLTFMEWLENVGRLINRSTAKAMINKIEAADKERQEIHSQAKSKPLAI